MHQAPIQSPLDDPTLLAALVDAFLHDVDEGMVLIDADARVYLEVNDAYCRMSGRRRQDLVGRSTDDTQPLAYDEDRERIGARLAAGESTFREDVWVRRVDRSVFFAEVTIRMMRAGERQVLFLTIVDVTTVRRAERELRGSQEQLRAVVSQEDELVLEFDDRGTCLDVWTGNEGLLGPAVDRIEGRTVEELFGDAAGAIVRTSIAEVLVHDIPGSRFAFAPADLSRWFLARVSRIAAAAGPHGATAVLYLRDISERHASEEALRRSEASARLLFAENPLPMWVWDPRTFGFIDVNDAAIREYGYSRDEFLSMSAFDIRPEDERERLAREVTDDDSLKHYGLWRHERKDGSELIAEIWSTLLPWGEGEARLSISLDVTDRVRAERALQEAEARYRSLIESIPAVVYLDRIGGPTPNVYVSPQVEGLIGYAPEEFERDPSLWQQVVHPEDREWVMAWNEEVTASRDHYDAEYRLVARDGRTVWVRDLGVPIPDVSGRPAYWQGFLTDTTQHKVAELRLADAELRARMILDNISDLVVLLDLEGRITYASPSHESVLGVPASTLVGEIAWQRVPPDEQAASKASFARAILGERTPGLRFRLLDDAGSIHEMEGSGWRPISDEAGKVVAVLSVSRDVSARRQVEQERRDMLGRIVAAGEEERRRIADDIHDAPIQFLTALGIRLETLRGKIVDADGLALLDRVIAGVADSVASLRSLMFDLRPPVLDREGLVPALRDSLAALSEDGGPPITTSVTDRITREPRPDTRIVLYRIAQEALANVRKHAEATHIEVTVESVDGGTRLRVEDDGRGLPADAWAMRRGHVGLSAMRERAGSLGGTFWIGPRADRGTLVEAWVPEPHDG